MKSLVPWMCFFAASVSQQVCAYDNFTAYRLGYYNKAAEALINQANKDPVADYYLGRLYLYGYGQLKNKSLALRYFTKAAEKGFLPAMQILAKYNLMQFKDCDQAVHWFKQAAGAGDVNAQMFMAAAYLFGIGVKQNTDVATKFYIDAAKNGNAIAQFTLAENFLDSRHSSTTQLGLIWLSKAATQGNRKALTRLGVTYAKGKLVDKDLAKAGALLNQAAAQNYSPAWVALGDLALEQGQYQKALEEYKRAVAQKDKEAYLSLAHAYLQDKSPIYDPNSGFLWTLKAAQEGVLQAKIELAELYKKGIGTAVNEELAKQWADLGAQNQKKGDKSSALAQAALWLSNGATDQLEQTMYQTGGILSAWQNTAVLRDNIYNQAPKFDHLSRKAMFKPNFALLEPNQVPISSFYDALGDKDAAFPANQWTYPRYPLNPQIEALEKEYSMATNKMNLPAPFMNASYYNYEDYSQASLMDLWTNGWQKLANFNSVFNQLYFRAILGDAQSQFEIGQMFQYGLGVEQNSASAAVFYQNAAEQQHLGAEYNLGILFLSQPQDAISYQNALNWLTDSAFKGNRNAQYVLARVLREGKKGPNGEEYSTPNQEQATSMLYLAAANHYGPAEYDLAETLSRGSMNTLSVDVQKRRIALIRQLYQSAANNGVVQALLPLAFYNAMDKDKQRQEKAFAVAKEQAENGDEMAALLLGLLYDRGIAVQQDFEQALAWYKRSGKNPVSQFILGTYSAMAKGVPEDKVGGMKLLGQSAQAKFACADFNLAVLKQQLGQDFLNDLSTAYKLGSSQAGLLLADYDLSEHNDVEHMRQAKEIYTGLAEKGDQHAQLKLGFMLNKGLGLSPDLLAAQRWYHASAEQGNPLAQYLLAEFYQLGEAGTPDYVLAKQWYQKAAQHLGIASVALGFIDETVEDNYTHALAAYQRAADQGDVNGIYDLALMYFYGKGIPVDYLKAKELLIQASNQGVVEAMNSIASMYFNGLGQTRDEGEAIVWYQKAAGLGNADALFQLGLFSEMGIGLKQDLSEAARYYKAAAGKGNERALLALARMYHYGIGMQKDLKKAAELYQELANKQNAYAQFALGTFYLEGSAGERSADKAKQLLRQAGENGSLEARQLLQKLDAQPRENMSVIAPLHAPTKPLIAGQ